MENSIKIFPTKIFTDKEYYFHVIGTRQSFRYDVERAVLQLMVQNVVTQEFCTPMTYEEFKENCSEAFVHSFVKLNRRN